MGGNAVTVMIVIASKLVRKLELFKVKLLALIMVKLSIAYLKYRVQLHEVNRLVCVEPSSLQLLFF
jgi:hypothetical protein